MDFFTFHEQVNQRTAPAPARAANSDPLTVSQLTARIDSALQNNLPTTLHVRGEISNYNQAASGHIYFTLKDARACIDCAIFRSDNVRLQFTPTDGLEVLATGNVKVYAQRGRYQLYVSRLEPVGQGALELAFRQLHARLEREGLFADERKKPIPEYPRRIVMVTSTQTAALQDMLKVLRRVPWLCLRVYHVPVQGDGSAEKVAAALHDLNRNIDALGGIDVILLGRGGGSLEDLWEFNEECVARAIAASRIPIITGIGHEVDVSIADLVADHHAHTPTEAAQVATTNWRNARELLDALALELRRSTQQQISEARQRLLHVERHELFRRPLDRVNQSRQSLDHHQRALALAMTNRIRRVQSAIHQLSTRLDRHHPAAVLHRHRLRLTEIQQRLARALSSRIRTAHDRLSRVTATLGERHPRHTLRLRRQHLHTLTDRLQRDVTAHLQTQRHHLDSLQKILHAVGPEQVLRRGYTITTTKRDGSVVRNAADVRPGDKLLTRFADGTVESRAEDTKQLSLFD